jgi:predicted esterase
MSSAFSNQPHLTAGDENADRVIIFLHGSGGGEAELCADMLNWLPEQFCQNTHFIFPMARSRPYTLCDGDAIPIWFDRTSLSADCREDKYGLEATVLAVRSLAREIRGRGHPGKSSDNSVGLQKQKIFIGGFSQGGCAALYSGYEALGAFKDEDKGDGEALFAGVLCMSSFLCDEALARLAEAAEAGLQAGREGSRVLPPLLFTAVTQDDMVPPLLSKRTLEPHLHFIVGLDRVQSDLTCDGEGHWISEACCDHLLSFVEKLT